MGWGRVGWGGGGGRGKGMFVGRGGVAWEAGGIASTWDLHMHMPCRWGMRVGGCWDKRRGTIAARAYAPAGTLQHH